MSKQAIVNIDLMAMTGTLKVVPPEDPLPRRDKTQLELCVANELISGIRQASSHVLDQLRSNRDDPPDVYFHLDGSEIGIELTEILPPNRLERDHVLASFRDDLLQLLNVGDRTRNRVVRIFFVECYAEKLRPGGYTKRLARLLNEHFASVAENTRRRLEVSPDLALLVDRVIVDDEDLRSDPRLAHPDHPLLIFNAQDTLIVTERDVPRMLEESLQDKFERAIHGRQWLLVWSSHPSIASIRTEITQGIGRCVAYCNPRYERIFYLDLMPPAHLWHWAIIPEEHRLFDRKPVQVPDS